MSEQQSTPIIPVPPGTPPTQRNHPEPLTGNTKDERTQPNTVYYYPQPMEL